MIKIDNLVFKYDDTSNCLLSNINVHIKKGEYLSIVGDNGCGKSTLLKLILNFLSPTKGSIVINTDKIGYVPQKHDTFNSGFPITVFEMLECHRKVKKITDKNVVTAILDTIKISNLKNSLIGDLSGGQRQKALIARALIGNPDLLILDEPSTGIDSHSQQDLYALIKKLNRELGITIVSVEHNLRAAISNSTSFLYMKDTSCSYYSSKDFAEQIGKEAFYA